MAATRLTTLPIVFLVAICLLAPLKPARGANTYWQHDPATPGDWFDPLNWSLGAIPTDNDFVYIDNNGTAAVDSGDAPANHMHLGYVTGHSGALTQTGGSTKVSTGLYLGYGAGSIGTYELGGTGNLESPTTYVGYQGTGTFTQSDGDYRGDDLYVGYYAGSQGTYVQTGGESGARHLYLTLYLGHNAGSSGTYDLSGGFLGADNEYIGGSGTGTFNQSGGWNNVVYLGVSGPGDAVSTYTLSGTGLLRGYDREVIGTNGGQGAFVQTGGIHYGYNITVGSSSSSSSPSLGSYEQTGGFSIVNGRLTVGGQKSTGAYELSGKGILSAYLEDIGYNGSGIFAQTGGLHTVSGVLTIGVSGGSGTYTLGGAGKLEADTIKVNGLSGFQQSGGTVAAQALNVNAGGVYSLSGGVVNAKALNVNAGGLYSFAGGALRISRQFTCPGILDFQDQPLTLDFPSGIIDLTTPSGIINASQASLVAGPHTLILYDPASPPDLETKFKNVTLMGLMQPIGSPLSIPASRTVIGWHDFTGHLDVQGVLDAVDGAINITGGLTVGPAGRVNLGTGKLVVENDTGFLAGDLTAHEEDIGYSGTATFIQSAGRNQAQKLYVANRAGSQGTYIQSAGTNQVGTLYLAYYPGSQGTYDLNGTGELTADQEYMGYTRNDVSGTGIFVQSGGRNTVGWLKITGPASPVCTYVLSGTGVLQAEYESISSGAFSQTGGTNTVNSLSLRSQSGADPGTYDLSGNGILSGYTESIGYSGSGIFTQTGGVNTVSATLYVGRSGGSGTYTLSGTGQLNAETISVNDSSNFQQSGGTVIAKVLNVSSGGLYSFSGGIVHAKALNVNAGGLYSLTGDALELSRQFTCAGTLDFQNQPTALSFPVSGIVDLTNPSGIVNASEASLVAGPNTLVLYDPASPPETIFKNVTTSGLTHTTGSDLVIPEGRTIIGWGTIDDFVDCRGTLTTDDPAGAINLNGGLAMGADSRVDLGTGKVKIDAPFLLESGALTARTESLGNFDGSSGTFEHSAGVNTADTLEIGAATGADWSYHLTGTGILNAEVVRASQSTYVQHDGQATIGTFTVGTCEIMSDAALMATDLTVYNSMSQGDNAALFVGTERIGPGVFTQTGGVNTVSTALEVFRLYTLSGTGQLDARTINVNNTSSFQQSGGTVTAKALNVKAGGLYSFSSGTLELNRGFTCPGTLDFQDQPTTLSFPVSGIINLTSPSGIVNASEASLVAGPNTLITYDPASPPETLFKNVSTSGLTHATGSSLVIPEDRTIVGWGTVNDFVDCRGTLTTDDPAGALYLNGGLAVGAHSRVDLGTGGLYIRGSEGGGLLTITDATAQISVGDLYFGPDARLSAVPGSVIHMRDAPIAVFENASTTESNLADLTNLTLVYDSRTDITAGPFEVASKDMGRTAAGFVDNFALGGIELGDGAALLLTNSFDNGNLCGVGGVWEALYVGKLTLQPGSTLDLGDYSYHLYVADLEDLGGTILNGELISLVPGDADGNWKVDSADLATWQQNYDPLGTSRTFDQGDWDGNGRIDSADLALWQRNYHPLYMGSGSALSSPEVTPEPATLLLLGSGLLTLARVTARGRRKLTYVSR